MQATKSKIDGPVEKSGILLDSAVFGDTSAGQMFHVERS